MSSIIRVLDMKERIDQECYFCGDKRSVKYAITEATDFDGNIIEDEVCCCNKCILQHTWCNKIPE